MRNVPAGALTCERCRCYYLTTEGWHCQNCHNMHRLGEKCSTGMRKPTIFCTHCHNTDGTHRIWCNYYVDNSHNLGVEVTQKFEVGDKVKVVGEITGRSVDTMFVVTVPYGTDTRYTTQRSFEPEALEFVSRPVKFKEGKKYRFPGIVGDERIYMYLGNRKFYAYHLDTSLFVERSENLVPVD